MNRNSDMRVFTRHGDVAGIPGYGQVRLGGVLLYGESQDALESTVDTLRVAFQRLVRAVPSADRTSAIAMLHAERKDLDRRVSAAVLGSALQQGSLCALCGEDEKAQLRMILCAPERRAAFEEHVGRLVASLQSDGDALIRDVRDSFFPGAGSGAWTWSWHIAARAVFLGRAIFLDRFRVAVGEDFRDVVGAPG